MTASDLILIVDDHYDSCQVLSEFFNTLGYRVEIAEDGKEGLKKFFDLRPCLIILDIRMPIMDGYEMLQRIRKKDKNVPVIVVSAQSQLDGVDECMKHGATDVLSKPVDLQQLEDRVNKYLKI
ncbi:response regulator [Nitrospina watsonii]|uniref:Signal transduction histidine kinase n=1 Tax=Nitrospina watsonii TaxID=1323948 RepID=A0ABM9HEE6_9BACT|nr:response regulator [Nitrospina watsonii]CAI2718626.1 Signal transduction histidine kinase [Nitrospina watsonii]